jgi:hypothetical protein
MKHLVIATAALIAAASSASAGIVFTTGAPVAGATGNEATLWIQANSFSLGSAATIVGGGVYVGSYTGDLSPWDGSFTYWIFADAGGAPGASLATGAAQNVISSDTGIAWCCGGNMQLLEFDLAAGFNAAAGTTYWLGIHLAADFDSRDELYWAGSFAGNHSESFGGTQNNWASFGPRHAFFLTGEGGVIPEPATWAMLIAGFGLVGAAARRRRTTATA